MTSHAKTDNQHDDLFQKGLNSIVKFGYSVLKDTPNSLIKGVSAGVGIIPLSNKMMTGQVDGLGDNPVSIGMQFALPFVVSSLSYLVSEGSEKVINLKKELYPEKGYGSALDIETPIVFGLGVGSMIGLTTNNPDLAKTASGLSLLVTFGRAIPALCLNIIGKKRDELKELKAEKASRNKADANTLG